MRISYWSSDVCSSDLIAEHQPSHARGGEVKNVKAVPAFFYQPGCLRESQCRSMNTGHGQCAAAQDHCRTLGIFENIVQPRRHVANKASIITHPFDLIRKNNYIERAT